MEVRLIFYSTKIFDSIKKHQSKFEIESMFVVRFKLVCYIGGDINMFEILSRKQESKFRDFT